MGDAPLATGWRNLFEREALRSATSTMAAGLRKVTAHRLRDIIVKCDEAPEVLKYLHSLQLLSIRTPTPIPS